MKSEIRNLGLQNREKGRKIRFREKFWYLVMEEGPMKREKKREIVAMTRKTNIVGNCLILYYFFSFSLFVINDLIHCYWF